jgi:hypothetical protein
MRGGVLHRRQIGDEQISPNKLSDALKKSTYFYWNGKANFAVLGSSPYSFPTAGDGNFGRVVVPPYGDAVFRMAGASQTVLGPLMSALAGDQKLAIGLTNLDAHGVEYVFNSVLDANGRLNHVVGTDPPMVIRAKLVVEDISGVGELAVGFRKVETFQALIDDYDEMACVNTQAGTVNIETILNGGGTSTADSGKTWADGEEHEVKVAVGTGYPGANNKGRVRYYFDGERVGSDAFVFDDGEVLTAFLHFLQITDASFLYLTELEVGFLRDFDDHYLF